MKILLPVITLLSVLFLIFTIEYNYKIFVNEDLDILSLEFTKDYFNNSTFLTNKELDEYDVMEFKIFEDFVLKNNNYNKSLLNNLSEINRLILLSYGYE